MQTLSTCKLDDVIDRQHRTGYVNVFNYNELL